MKECPRCGNRHSDEAFSSACSYDVTGAPAITADPAVHASVVERLANRYRDAYGVGRVIVGFGTTIKTVGIGIGALTALLAIIAGLSSPVSAVAGLLAAAILGGLFYLLGVLTSASGQILQASLDTAVNTSPFLENTRRAEIMALESSRGERLVPVASTQNEATEFGEHSVLFDGHEWRCVRCGEGRRKMTDFSALQGCRQQTNVNSHTVSLDGDTFVCSRCGEKRATVTDYNVVTCVPVAADERV